MGISLSELGEESKFGRSARREILKWFPTLSWVRTLDEKPAARELLLIDRRRFLWTMGLTAVGVAACNPATLSLIFEAIKIAAELYTKGTASDGSALFSNGSQSREAFQLLTSLVQGDPDSEGVLQDEDEVDVDVPANVEDYVHLFGGLVSEETGDHYVQGKAIGKERNTNVFQYE